MSGSIPLALRGMAEEPTARRMATKGLHIARTGTLQQFFDCQRKAQEIMFRTTARREGVRRRIENRPAQVTGR
jgi:hypothetical protein